ncbi:ORM1-like protein 1 [Geodia barretti]|uniref:ORM1-like protein 1 n=2 Tax=Geodia barretti TaxID=519541 RepID=A0AA35X324_GEOBA|nr:ORM1-like protein 1 [Geodia barretti]
MQVMSATAITNPNASWLNTRGMWLGYLTSVAILHFILLSVPLFSTAMAWTLTHVVHNVGMYIMFHHMKGTPYPTGDQGDVRRLTNWEQIDNGHQYTPTRIFLTSVPIFLFFLASFYTFHDRAHVTVNLIALAVGVIPKFPALHKFRLYGINRY